MPAKDNNRVQQQKADETREAVFEALVVFIEENGYSPTRKELAARTELAEITVRRHLVRLQQEGRVSEDRGHRTLRPLI